MLLEGRHVELELLQAPIRVSGMSRQQILHLGGHTVDLFLGLILNSLHALHATLGFSRQSRFQALHADSKLTELSLLFLPSLLGSLLRRAMSADRERLEGASTVTEIVQTLTISSNDVSVSRRARAAVDDSPRGGEGVPVVSQLVSCDRSGSLKVMVMIEDE